MAAGNFPQQMPPPHVRVIDPVSQTYTPEWYRWQLNQWNRTGGAAGSNAATVLQSANNLSDLQSAAKARSNLGLGSAAVQPVSAFLQPAKNLSDLQSVATAQSNLGLGSAATQSASAFLSSTPIAAGHVIGNGTGSTATPADSTMTSILDQAFSSTQGSILYRGASGWAALGPGTSGQVLQTGGASANPSWVAQGGGGVNTAGLYGLNLNSGASFSSGFWGGRAIRLQAGSTFSKVHCYATAAAATAQVTPAIYADTPGTLGTLIAQGSTVTGLVKGENALPLSAPLTVSSDTWLWVGFICQVVSVNLATTAEAGSAFFSQATNTPPSTAPTATYTTQTWASMWLGA